MDGWEKGMMETVDEGQSERIAGGKASAHRRILCNEHLGLMEGAKTAQSSEIERESEKHWYYL